MERSRRLVLASGFANAALAAAVQRLGWRFLGTVPPEGAAATEYAWRIDPEHTFHYFECTGYPVEYCQVLGTRANETLMRVSAELDFMDVDDLISAFDRAGTPEEAQATTFALGLAAGDVPEDDVADRIRAAAAHGDPRVRIAAIDAAFVTGWETFVDDLRRLSGSDPDPVVSETATLALEASPHAGGA